MSTRQCMAVRDATFPRVPHSRLAGALGAAIMLAGTLHSVSAQERSPAKAAANGSAGSSADAVGSDNAGQLATVVVTGTSILSADAGAYQSAPITVISADTLQNSGAPSLERFFQTQPDFLLSGQSSFTNTGGGGGETGTQVGATTLNIRGIGPQYTLVLVNGRRFQAESPANIDLIPKDAIERIEVLKSGASAVYGSDAVAGVVNIITKRTDGGLSFDGYYGGSSQGDTPEKRFSASWGTSTDKLNFFAAAEYSTRGGLRVGQRALSANPDLSRFNPGFNYQTFPYSALSQIFMPGPMVLNQQSFTCGGFSRNPADYVPLNSHLYATGCDAQLDEGKRSLINAQRKGTFFAALDYNFSDNLSLYADFDFARNLVESTGNTFGADGFGDVRSSLQLSPISADNYWNPFGVPIAAVAYGFPEAGPQVDDIDSSTWRLNLGITGAIGRIHYDIGGSYYYNYANAFDYNMPTNAGLYAAENRPGPLAINFFCNACNTPAQIAGVFSGTSTQDWEEALLFNAHAYAPVYTLPGGDINLAGGLEYQRNAYIVQPSQAILDDVFNDFLVSPVSLGRRYSAVYLEGQLPIFGKDFAFPGAASLGIDVAARYENIQFAGSRTDPTVSARWEPIADSVAVRASYGTSFRAPSLINTNAPTTTVTQALINPVTGLTQDYDVTSGGNKNLKPETATYINYGLVLTPRFAPGLTLQLDRWIINQKNIVIVTQPQLILDGIQPGGMFVGANGVPGVTALYMNAAGQKVNGVDLNVDYHFRTASAGSFDFRWAGTYLSSFKVDEATAAGFVQYAGGTALASSLPSVTGLPKVRFLLAANWLYGAFSANYILHYTGSYEDPTIGTGVPVDKYVTHDIQLGLDFGKLVAPDSRLSGLKLAVGVNDLTYAKVPIFYAGSAGAGILATGYDTSIVNPTGRFFYAQLHLSLPRK